MQNLVVHEDNMLKNTKLYGGIVYSQKVLLKLVEKGLTREEAYRIVQQYALDALEGANFKEELLKDSTVLGLLSKEEIEACFEIEDYLKNVDKIFDKMQAEL